MGPLLTVATIFIGLWQFDRGEQSRLRLEHSLIQRKDELDFARQLWLERMKQCGNVAALAGKIIAHVGDEQQKLLNTEFEAAYYGAMIFVEDEDVEKAMIRFRVALKDFSDGWVDVDHLKIRADELIKVCRKSVEKGGPQKS